MYAANIARRWRLYCYIQYCMPLHALSMPMQPRPVCTGAVLPPPGVRVHTGGTWGCPGEHLASCAGHPKESRRRAVFPQGTYFDIVS